MPDSFRDVLFPTGLAYGFRGGPGFNTTVMELASGFERRNINWSKVRGKYDISHLMKKPDKFAELLNFFYSMIGRAYSFKFWDNKDDTITAQVMGAGDGVQTMFQIFKRYSVTNGTDVWFYDRLITKIQANTIGGVIVGATPYSPGVGATGYSVNLTTGVITFNVAPPDGDDITVGSVKFYVHVRFDADDLDSEYSNWDAISWGSILLVEIKEEAA